MNPSDSRDKRVSYPKPGTGSANLAKLESLIASSPIKPSATTSIASNNNSSNPMGGVTRNYVTTLSGGPSSASSARGIAAPTSGSSASSSLSSTPSSPPPTSLLDQNASAFGSRGPSSSSASLAEFSTGPVTDEKYQKLLSEFQKLKSNNAILKKAVLMEQEKSANIDTVLQEKDQSIRGYLEENDLLQFNNEQLEKRIQMLMQNIEEMKKSASNSRWFGGSKEDIKTKAEQGVLREELMNKIAESEKLHMSISELRKEHEVTVSTLEAKLSQLKKQLQRKQEEIDDSKTSNDKIAAERNSLMEQLRHTQEMLVNTNSDIERKEKDLRMNNERLANEIRQLMSVLQKKVPFDDTKYDELNQLNVGPFDRRAEEGKWELLSAAVSAARELISHYVSISQALSEKLLVYNKQYLNDSTKLKMRSIHSKIQLILPKHEELLSALFESLQLCAKEFRENSELAVTTRSGFLRAFAAYVAYQHKFVSYQTMRLKEEFSSASASASSTLTTNDQRVRNELLSSGLKSQLNSLHRLNNYVTLLLSPNSKMLPANEGAVIRGIVTSLQSIRNSTKSYSTLFLSQLGQENRLLTENSNSNSIRSANEKLALAQSNVATFTGKLCGSLEEFCKLIYQIHFSADSSTSTPMSHSNTPSNSAAQNRARSFISQLNSLSFNSKFESIPYEEAIRLRKQLPEFEQQIESLKKSIQSLKDELAAAKNESSVLRQEAVTNKDALLQKSNQVASILQELAVTRDKLAATSAQAQKATENLRAAAAAGKKLSEQFAQERAAKEEFQRQVEALRRASALVVPAGDLLQLDGSAPMTIPASTPAVPMTTASISGMGSSTASVFEDVFGSPPPPSSSVAAVISASNSNPNLNNSQSIREEILLADVPAPDFSKNLAPLNNNSTTQNVVSRNLLSDNSASSLFQNMAAELATPTPSSSQLSANAPSVNVSASASSSVSRGPIVTGQYSMVVMDQSGNQSNTLGMTGPDIEREESLKNFYESKVKQMEQQLQLHDQQAVQLHSKLMKELEERIAERDLIFRKRAELEDQLRTTKEDLEMTRNSYDQHLKVFSEEMIAQQGKITAAEKDLSSLKSTRIVCPKCKVTGTVEQFVAKTNSALRT